MLKKQCGAMLSFEFRKLIARDIEELIERKKNIFTREIITSNTYARINVSLENLSESEAKLKNLVDEFDEKIIEAKNNRYEYGMPSYFERKEELEKLLNDIENQVKLILWD